MINILCSLYQVSAHCHVQHRLFAQQMVLCSRLFKWVFLHSQSALRGELCTCSINFSWDANIRVITASVTVFLWPSVNVLEFLLRVKSMFCTAHGSTFFLVEFHFNLSSVHAIPVLLFLTAAFSKSSRTRTIPSNNPAVDVVMAFDPGFWPLCCFSQVWPAVIEHCSTVVPYFLDTKCVI